MVSFRPGQFGAAEKIAREALENPKIRDAVTQYESARKALVAAAKRSYNQTGNLAKIATSKASVSAGNARTNIRAALKNHADLDAPVAEHVAAAIESGIKELTLPSNDPLKAIVEKEIAACAAMGSSRAG